MPFGVPLAESVCVGYGGVDSYDFHGLETAQCMSERRCGGEVGIRRVQAVRGAAMWEQLATANREVTRKLMVAALTRSHNLPVDTGYPSDRVTFEWARHALPETVAYFIEHRDGFRTTLFLAAIRDFNYAGLRGTTARSSPVKCICRCPVRARQRPTSSIRWSGTSKRWFSMAVPPTRSSGRC